MSTRLIRKTWWVDFYFKKKRYRLKSPINSRAGATGYQHTLLVKLLNGEEVPLSQEQPTTHMKTNERYCNRCLPTNIREEGTPLISFKHEKVTCVACGESNIVVNIVQESKIVENITQQIVDNAIEREKAITNLSKVLTVKNVLDTMSDDQITNLMKRTLKTPEKQTTLYPPVKKNKKYTKNMVLKTCAYEKCDKESLMVSNGIYCEGEKCGKRQGYINHCRKHGLHGYAPTTPVEKKGLFSR